MIQMSTEQKWKTESARVNTLGVLYREGDLLLESGWEPFCVSAGVMYFRRLVREEKHDEPQCPDPWPDQWPE